MKLGMMLGGLVLVGAAPAFADSAFKFDKGSISYTLIHKAHTSVGVNKSLDGAAVIKDDTLLAQVRATVAEFDSGNSGRDAHMKETTEITKYPYVTLKGKAKGFKMPDKFPADVKVNLDADVEFHGTKVSYTVPLELHFDSATSVNVKTHFNISLDAHKVERPSLMFVPVEDDVKIDVDATFAPKG